jgi:hypothetical protein
MDVRSVRTVSLAHPESMLIRVPTNTARMRDIELALKRGSRKTWLKSGSTAPMLGGKHPFTVDFSLSAFPFVLSYSLMPLPGNTKGISFPQRHGYLSIDWLGFISQILSDQILVDLALLIQVIFVVV